MSFQSGNYQLIQSSGLLLKTLKSQNTVSLSVLDHKVPTVCSLHNQLQKIPMTFYPAQLSPIALVFFPIWTKQEQVITSMGCRFDLTKLILSI